ncbi:glycoside hydrolase family 25 protein [Corynebacterium nuruki]|jgi:lysozyme|uniref:Glycoside hydrolase n=1 Tax=Corynebacterium nuruki TaxID=1032851 RepID=A0A3D4T0D4_9CORY|nr:GH25 family lysozyme [Corynebacterium nuruki]HCT14973.1 glycoside hydrolase [Corynebacterium nuruki]
MRSTSTSLTALSVLSLATAACLTAATLPAAAAEDSAGSLGGGGGGTVAGIDVSSHQHNESPVSDWIAARGAGTGFVYVKATEGTDYVNPNWIGDVNLARTTGIRGGSYHYARPSDAPGDAAAQANTFATATIGSPAPTLTPVLDLEESGGLSPEQLQSWVRDYLNVLKLRTGRDAVIYTYPNFWRDAMGDTAEFSDHPLWIADYNGGSAPDLPGGWDNWTIWQTGSDGTVPGVEGPVDQNVFNGDAQGLDRMLG